MHALNTHVRTTEAHLKDDTGANAFACYDCVNTIIETMYDYLCWCLCVCVFIYTIINIE